VSLLLLGLDGCLAGIGPTVGVRSSGELSAGWEASTSLANGGIELGQSIPLGPRRATTYGAIHGFRHLDDASDDETATFLGASLGIAGGEGGYLPYPSVWPMVLMGDRGCRPRDEPGGRAVFTVQLGMRWIGGGWGELYLAPKLNYFAPLCQT
jgi:hypothetical protein